MSSFRGIRIEPYVSGLREPTAIAAPSDGSGRLFVMERRGAIRIVRSGKLESQPFLDISNLVGSSETEQGLLGLAFHPKFRENGRFFVNYTDKRGNTVVAGYRANGGRAVETSAQTILAVDQPYPNHNGGNIVFGPDGYLYIGLGDGGSGGDPRGNGQNLGVLLGKMLRIDVDSGQPYAIPPDNPFRGRTGARPEIWAYGLRNPWRYQFDRLTGDLYISDVGQDQFEEINFQPAKSKGGENYGWNKMEGLHCYPVRSQCTPSQFVAPIVEYNHANGGCSVTGGYVYRGKSEPLLVGRYLFSDFCSGRFWAASRDTSGNWEVQTVLASRRAISTFGEDETGELYAAGYGDGTIYRIRAAS